MVWPIIVAAGSGFGGVGPSYEAGESQSIPGSRCLNSDITVRERTRRLARAGFPTVQGQDFSAVSIRYLECCPRPLCRERCLHMKKTERVRQVVAGAVSEGEIKEQTEKGWKLVALEWEREVEAAEEKLPVEVPFGLRVSPDTRRLEVDSDLGIRDAAATNRGRTAFVPEHGMGETEAAGSAMTAGRDYYS